MKQPSLVRLCIEIQERNIFASTKTNTFTCDLSCKRCVDCVQCNAHLCCTISSVGSVCMVHTTTQLGPKPPHCRGFYVDHTQLRHTHTHTHTHVGLSERVISPSQRPLLPQHTTNTRDEHPCHQRDSNARSQQYIYIRVYAIVCMMTCGTHLASVMHISKVHCKLRFL